jgi:exodeoxyribonuclease V alpha subunit
LLARFVADGVAPERIALAAPTGRAAARMGEAIGAALRRDVEAGRIGAALAASIPRDAKTLHRLLGWQKGKAAFRHDARNPLPHEVVVVDEASMIDLPLMAKLVAAVRDAATLVLLGDPDQLPAVEAGDVLGALCDAPALAAARVHLRHGWRQSEAPRLSALAKTVGEGDGEAALAALRAGGDGLQWREGGVAQLEAALAEFALPDYRAMLAAPDPHAALELAARSRVLTALRHGPFGAAAWNAWFARRLGGGASAWFHGRLVMVVANDYRLELFNGDTGIAWEDGRGEIAVWFGRRGAPLRPAQLPAHDSAYATTVHKAQGSEFDRVALVLPDADSRVLNRELVYTALTRARSGVLVWGAEAQLRTAIRTSSRRESGLAEQLKALRD